MAQHWYEPHRLTENKTRQNMFKLNLKIALRNILKNRVSSFINVTGLAIGLAASLMLLLYVSYELNFDKHSKDSDHVYIAMSNVKDESGKIAVTFDGTPTAFSPVVKQGIPEVRYISKMNYGAKRLIAYGENTFKKQAKFAEPDLLKIYDYEFIAGNPTTALTQPKSVILTESTAKTLFGTNQALNKSVKFENQEDLTVTGVIKDLPENSSNKFDFLMPWSFYEMVNENARDLNWSNYSYITLLMLRPDADVNLVNQKLSNLVKRYQDIKFSQPQFLFPLSKLHLHGKFEAGKSVGGAIEQVWLFIGLAFGILMIACVNFMNMATAKSERRSKEVGIKKTIGATRGSLIAQFLIESVLLSLFSIVIALALVEAFLPSFNSLLNIKMEITYFNIYYWAVLLGIVLLTGLVAGSYPAFYLSSFNPVQALRKKVSASGLFSISIRQLLIIGQFCFTVLLIISTLVIYKQIQYIKDKPLGSDVNTLVEMPQDGMLVQKYDLLKTRLLASGAVTSLCQSSESLIHHNSFFKNAEWPGSTPAQRNIMFNRVATTYDFIKTNGLKLLSGRDFSRQHASDSVAVLVSASAVKTMELKTPIGTSIRIGGQDKTIIGVFEDYVWDSPYKSSTPLFIYFNKENTGTITMRLNPENNLHQNIETITKISKELNPSYPVELRFTNEVYEMTMEKEQRLGALSNIFGGLAIFVSCLGLYALVAFSAAQRTKEFGIRKVLGASVTNLMQLLSWSFLKLICIAIFITVPFAYYMMNKWLQNFEYHTNISWWLIAAASAGTLAIALMTLSYQAYKSAISNPSEALKYE
eukprot:gene2814-3236_t